MALRRHYSVDVNGVIYVRDTQTGVLSAHYRGNVLAPAPFGRTEADLYVATDGSHVLQPNGMGRAAVQACMDLLTTFSNDLGRQQPDPLAF